MYRLYTCLRIPVCGRFYPNEGGVAGYAEAF
ncbi:DUF6783 domain-containing protein [Oliverpabstia intestinalis]